MLNLILTNKCNLNCSYCFAQNIKNETTEEFSIENILKILDFIKIDGTNQIGLIGGEPFLHSKINNILKLLIKRNSIKDVIIYSNGIFDKKLTDILSDKKFKLLINCNSPVVLSDKYKLLTENLKTLNSYGKKKISVGINLSNVNFDYNYIFDLMHKLKKQILRVSFATTTEFKKEIDNPLEYLKTISPYILNFYRDCLNNEIIPFPSCNSIPPCILTTRDKKLFLEIFSKSNKLGLNSMPIMYFLRCKPVLDIFPNLMVSRCFGFLDNKVPLFNFSSVSEISNYFINNNDALTNIYINGNSKCKDCKYNKIKMCKLCLAYCL